MNPEPEEFAYLDEDRKTRIMKELHEEIERQKAKYFLNNTKQLGNDNLKESNEVSLGDDEHKQILNNAKNNLKQIQEDIKKFSNTYKQKLDTSVNKENLYSENECNEEDDDNEEQKIIDSEKKGNNNDFIYVQEKLEHLKDERPRVLQRENVMSINNKPKYNFINPLTLVNEDTYEEKSLKKKQKNKSKILRPKSVHKAQNISESKTINKTSNKSQKKPSKPFNPNKNYDEFNKISKRKYEEMKKELQDKFVSDHPFKPSINNNIEILNNETAAERYQRLSKPRTAEINERIKKKQQEEIAKVEKNLNKNRHKNVNPDKVSNRLFKLHEQMKEKKERIKQMYDENEVKAYSFIPEINEKSKVLMTKYDQKDLYERNLEFEKVKVDNIIRIRQQLERQQKEQGNPVINQKSKQIVSNQRQDNSYDIFTRLYQDNQKKSLKKYENADMKECTFSPQLNYNFCENNENDLYDEEEYKEKSNLESFLERQQRYEEIKKDKLKRKKEANQKKNEYSFKPTINTTSEILAKTNQKRIDNSGLGNYERLYQDAERLKERKEQLQHEYISQYNFAPKINELSKYIGKNMSENYKTYTTNYRKNDLEEPYNHNKYSKFVTKKGPIDENCTFKPDLNKDSKYEYIQSSYKNDEGMMDRIREEVKSKEAKLKQMHEAQQYDDIKECNFQPIINRECPDFESNKPIYIKGMAKYLEQMEKARQAKRDKEQREREVFTTGENWNRNNLITVPKPFKLSYQNKYKLDEIKKEMQHNQMKECTFKPVTNETKNKKLIQKLLKDD